MKSICPYLIFNGSCREALEFYATCFGGQIELIVTFAESPLDVAEDHSDLIYHSVMVAEEIQIMASDTLPEFPIEPGNNVAMFVNMSDATELQSVFNQLEQGGTRLMDIEDNFGMLQDKFGIRWMLNAS